MHRSSKQADRAQRRRKEDFPLSQVTDSSRGSHKITHIWLTHRHLILIAFKKYIYIFFIFLGFGADGKGAGQRVG